MRALASYREAFRAAVRSVHSSKLRSFLTLLGVILATTALIVVMSLVHGMDVYVAETVSDMGTDGYQVQRIPLLGDFDPKKMLELDKKNPKLRAEEYQYIKSHLTLSREFGMQAFSSVQIRYKNQKLDSVDLSGVTANTAVISDISVSNGRFLTEIDDQRRSGVVFIGEDVRNKFFANTDPVGKTISLDGSPFQVVGTATKRGSVFGFSRDNFAMIPHRRRSSRRSARTRRSTSTGWRSPTTGWRTRRMKCARCCGHTAGCVPTRRITSGCWPRRRWWRCGTSSPPCWPPWRWASYPSSWWWAVW